MDGFWSTFPQISAKQCFLRKLYLAIKCPLTWNPQTEKSKLKRHNYWWNQLRNPSHQRLWSQVESTPWSGSTVLEMSASGELLDEGSTARATSSTTSRIIHHPSKSLLSVRLLNQLMMRARAWPASSTDGWPSTRQEVDWRNGSRSSAMKWRTPTY